MKKIITFVFVAIMILFTGCNRKNNNNIEKIPIKINSTDTASSTSPVNSHNLDKYLFRDDVKYVDLRSIKTVLEEGYVAGFEFIPYYSIIASFRDKEALYKMANITKEDGSHISAGQVGGFVEQYEESNQLIEYLFPKNKYIFFISQAGSEGAYVINLLLQLGYNSSLLYNVGGVSAGEGIDSYRSVTTNKYYVSGNSGYKPTVSYDFINDLTPIE